MVHALKNDNMWQRNEYLVGAVPLIERREAQRTASRKASPNTKSLKTRLELKLHGQIKRLHKKGKEIFVQTVVIEMVRDFGTVEAGSIKDGHGVLFQSSVGCSAC